MNSKSICQAFMFATMFQLIATCTVRVYMFRYMYMPILESVVVSPVSPVFNRFVTTQGFHAEVRHQLQSLRSARAARQA